MWTRDEKKKKRTERERRRERDGERERDGKRERRRERERDGVEKFENVKSDAFGASCFCERDC